MKNTRNGASAYSLAETRINKEPLSVSYGLSTREIEQFGMDFFKPKVDKLEQFRVFAKKGGRIGSQLIMIAFINMDSSMVSSESGSWVDVLAPMVKGKIESPVSIKGSLANVFTPFSFGGHIRYSVRSVKGGGPRLLCIELDPFAVLGFMLSVHRGVEEIVIPKIEMIDKRTSEMYINVVKRKRDVVSDKDFNDVYNQIYAQMSHH